MVYWGLRAVTVQTSQIRDSCGRTYTLHSIGANNVAAVLLPWLFNIQVAADAAAAATVKLVLNRQMQPSGVLLFW